jgi:hypothetical protein
MQGQKSKSMSSEQEGAKGSKEMKAEGREGTKDMKAEGREGSSKEAQGREGQTTTERKGAADSKSQTTTESQTGTCRPPDSYRTASRPQHRSTLARLSYATNLAHIVHEIAPTSLPLDDIQTGEREPFTATT